MDVYAKINKLLIFPIWMIKDEKVKLFSYLREFEKDQFKNKKEIESIQLERLKKIVNHAYNNCEFYKSEFLKAGIKPSDIQNFSDYLKVPILTKSDIQDNLQQLVAKNYKKSDLIPNKTGGSTGTPINFFHDKERGISMDASAIRHNRWAGHDIGDKLAVIWGYRPDWAGMRKIKGQLRNLILERNRILDSSSITDEKLCYFEKVLRRFKPKTILAYANSIYFFSKFIKAKGVRDIRPDSIITSAEMLYDDRRDLIEEVFGCQVFDRYGSREVGVIASECQEHTGLHITANTLYIEFIDEKGMPVSPGEEGDIIVTDLLNYGMPFLRYKIGDRGIPSEKLCPCGRGLPLIDKVAGRTTDFIITPSGKQVSGAALTIYLIANISGVRQAQIIQKQKNHLIFKIVQGVEFDNKNKRLFDEKVKEFFGKEMNYEIKFVDHIPNEPSGKYRFSISILEK